MLRLPTPQAVASVTAFGAARVVHSYMIVIDSQDDDGFYLFADLLFLLQGDLDQQHHEQAEGFFGQGELS